MTTQANLSKHQWRKYVIGPLLTVVVWLLLLYNLDTTPPPWWDEGWTLTVARTWVERGHYGMLKLGELAPPGLNAAWPVTASFALGFKLLGVGVWQARFVSVLYTVGTLVMLAILTRRFYGSRVAWIALIFAVWCAPALDLMPTLFGREVMAEMPMLFFLLAGYICYDKAHHNLFWLSPAMFLWALGLLCKAQPFPFWLISLAIPSLIYIKFKQWKWTGLTIASLLSTLVLMVLLNQIWTWYIAGHTFVSAPVQGLTKTVALTFGYLPRLNALIYIGFLSWEMIPGVFYGLASLIRRNKGKNHFSIAPLPIWLFTTTWIGWYTLFSAGWLRYLFPAYFVSHSFSAALFDKVSNSVNMNSMVQNTARLFKRVNWQTLGALWSTVIIGSYLMSTIVYQGIAIKNQENFVYQTAAFINALPETIRIESYESELFFLINRTYHYPPDQLHVAIIRRNLENIPLSISYDPLFYDPDYLVLGKFNFYWGVYAPELITRHFTLIKTFGPYQIYQRKP